MSASREKKKRQETMSSGVVDAKAARAAEQKAAERKSNILYGTVAVAFIVVAVVLLVYNSGIIQRSQTAVTIDGQKYTVPQTAYYYQNVCSSYASMVGQEYLQSMKSEIYNGDQTWDDYFKESAVNNMKFVHAAKTAAAAEGVTLDADDETVIKNNIDSMKSTASASGYSYGAYLKAMYGNTMSASIFESCLRDQLLASKYASKYSEDNFVYTDDEIEAYYNEHRDSYDLIDGAYVTVSGSPEAKTDDEGNTIEATDEEKSAAMEAAKATAEEILAAYKAGGDLEQLASSHDATYTSTTPSATSAAGEWLYASARRAGDAEVVENTDSSCYYVMVFNSRERDTALDYNVRHILVTADSLDLAEGEEATDEMLKAKADEILASWDGTEEGFANLANEYSQDGGSNTNGGLYEDVVKGQMVAAFQDWCYEEGRQPGDTGIVYSSTANYTGYHIMYFVGYGDTEYWHYSSENDMRSAAETEWQNTMTESVAAETNASGMKNL